MSSRGSSLTRGGVEFRQGLRRGRCTTCPGKTTTTNLPVFMNICSGGEPEPIDSNSASSDSESIFGSTISEKESFDFAAPAVDIPISQEMGNSGATSALPNSTSATSNESDSELRTSTLVLGPSALSLPPRAFRFEPSASNLPLRVFRFKCCGGLASSATCRRTATTADAPTSLAAQPERARADRGTSSPSASSRTRQLVDATTSTPQAAATMSS